MKVSGSEPVGLNCRISASFSKYYQHLRKEKINGRDRSLSPRKGITLPPPICYNAYMVCTNEKNEKFLHRGYRIIDTRQNERVRSRGSERFYT